MTPRFTAESLRFLRALKRHNDREWFRARRDRYERDVRAPMIAVIERLAVDFKRFAPEIIASPKASLYRIYRDTRFSDDKSPLNTQISASFRWRDLPKGEAAGLYLEINPGSVWMGGGNGEPHRFLQAVGRFSSSEIDRLERGEAMVSVNRARTRSLMSFSRALVRSSVQRRSREGMEHMLRATNIALEGK